MAKARRKKQRYERVRYDSGQHRRILAVMAVLGLLAFLPGALRLHQLMVVQYDYYAGMAGRNQSRTTPVAANRGVIYDTNMNILACGRSVENVYLAPNELKQAGEDLSAIAQALAQILDMDAGLIEKRRPTDPCVINRSPPMWSRKQPSRSGRIFSSRILPASTWSPASNGIIPTVRWRPKLSDSQTHPTQALRGSRRHIIAIWRVAREE